MAVVPASFSPNAWHDNGGAYFYFVAAFYANFVSIQQDTNAFPKAFFR